MKTLIISPATTLSFEQSTYTVDEPDSYAQLVLVLSNPSSNDIIVQVLTGEYLLTMYCNKLLHLTEKL